MSVNIYLEPFHSQVDRRYFAALQLLLQRCAFVDALDWNCRTPLMMAAAAGLPEPALQALLQAGADVAATDLDCASPLHMAYAFGSLASAIVLESAGADPSARNLRGLTPSETLGAATGVHPIFASCAAAAVRSSSQHRHHDDSEAKENESKFD